MMCFVYEGGSRQSGGKAIPWKANRTIVTIALYGTILTWGSLAEARNATVGFGQPHSLARMTKFEINDTNNDIVCRPVCLR